MHAESVAVSSELRSRRERKKERTRQEIYRAAMDLFLARGFDSVTIEEICQAADVARGTFFLHFPTKDALLLEYGVQVTQELDALLESHGGGATTALRKILMFLAERATRHAAIVQLLVRETMLRPSTLADVAEQSRGLSDFFADLVRQGQQSGELRRAVNPRLAAAMITSSYFTIVGEWARGEKKFDLAATIQQSLHIILHGLATAKGKTS